MPPYFLSLLAAFALALGGCTSISTSQMWSHASSREPTYTDIGEDRLLSLRLTQAAAGGIPAGTLVFIGEKNWYVANKESSERFTEILTAGLAAPFYFADDNPTVIIDDLERRYFIMPVRLACKPDAADRARLDEMGNYDIADDGEYSLASVASGTYYPAPATLPADDRAIPINLPLRLRQQTGYKHSFRRIAAAAIATPITLAADAVTLITIAPLIGLANPRHMP